MKKSKGLQGGAKGAVMVIRGQVASKGAAKEGKPGLKAVLHCGGVGSC